MRSNGAFFLHTTVYCKPYNCVQMASCKRRNKQLCSNISCVRLSVYWFMKFYVLVYCLIVISNVQICTDASQISFEHLKAAICSHLPNNDNLKCLGMLRNLAIICYLRLLLYHMSGSVYITTLLITNVLYR